MLVLSGLTKQLAQRLFILSFTEYSYVITQLYNTAKDKNTIYGVFTLLIVGQKLSFQAFFEDITEKIKYEKTVFFLSFGG